MGGYDPNQWSGPQGPPQDLWGNPLTLLLLYPELVTLPSWMAADVTWQVRAVVRVPATRVQPAGAASASPPF